MIQRRTLLTLALSGVLAADACGALAGDNGGRILPDPVFGSAPATRPFGVRPVPPPPAPRFGTPKKRRDGVSFTPEFTIRAPSRRNAAAAADAAGPSPNPDGGERDASTAAAAAQVRRPSASGEAPTRQSAPATGNRATSPRPQARTGPSRPLKTPPVVPKPAPQKARPATSLAGHGGDPTASAEQAARPGTTPRAALAPRRHPHRSEPAAPAAAAASAPPEARPAEPRGAGVPDPNPLAAGETVAPALAAIDAKPAADAADDAGAAAHGPFPAPAEQPAGDAVPPPPAVDPAAPVERTTGAEHAGESAGEALRNPESASHTVGSGSAEIPEQGVGRTAESGGGGASAGHGGDESRPEDAEGGGGDEAEAEAADEAFDPVWDTPDTEARPDGPTPARLGRMLTALQDDIALGSPDALTAQRVLSRRIAERFRSATPKEWREDANARALVLYGLSGGDPKVLRAVLKRTKLKRPYRSLAAGALAYLEGRANDARRHFAEVGDDTLPHSLKGSVLLARAALNVSEDPAAALALLDEARIAAPGTLVEEAALRRAILIASEHDDVDTFERLVGRYLRTFRASVYAGNFRQRLAAAITRMTFIRDPAAFGRLESMLAPMTPAGRQELYLLMARAAIENGNPVAAQVAARRVQDSADPASLDNLRARLYQAAAEVVDAPLALSARATLAGIAAEPLPAADRALLEAAQELARSVTDLPPPSPAALPGDGADPDAPAAPATSRDAPIALDVKPDVADRWSPPAELEARVADVLTATDVLLETPQ